MKTLLFIACAGLVLATACEKKDKAEEKNGFDEKCAPGITRVFLNAYDDGWSTVYLRIAEPNNDEDEMVKQLMLQKKEWEKKFPANRVVSISIVTSVPKRTPLYNNVTIVVGMLMHYEKR